MKKFILGILIVIVSMVILGFMITVVSLAAFAGLTDTKSQTKTETQTEVAVLSFIWNVIGEFSGEALVGDQVLLQGTDVKNHADFDGHFMIENMKQGQCESVASHTSIFKIEQSFTINSKTNHVKIELTASK